MKTSYGKIEGYIKEEYNDGSCILLNPNGEIVHLLNATASLLYSLCDSEINKEDLFAIYIDKLDLTSTEISIEEVRSDFDSVMKEFIENGILHEIID